MDEPIKSFEPSLAGHGNIKGVLEMEIKLREWSRRNGYETGGMRAIIRRSCARRLGPKK